MFKESIVLHWATIVLGVTLGALYKPAANATKAAVGAELLDERCQRPYNYYCFE